jgi:hypothetical protein
MDIQLTDLTGSYRALAIVFEDMPFRSRKIAKGDERIRGIRERGNRNELGPNLLCGGSLVVQKTKEVGG